MRLLFLSCSWIGGIYLGSWLELSLLLLLLGLGGSLVLLFLWRKAVVVWGVLCLLALVAGVLVFSRTVEEPSVKVPLWVNKVPEVPVRVMVEAEPAASNVPAEAMSNKPVERL